MKKTIIALAIAFVTGAMAQTTTTSGTTGGTTTVTSKLINTALANLPIIKSV